MIATIEKRCDCVCVHHVGFTFTLFREAGLPRPPKTTLQVAAAVESQEAQEEGPRQGDAEGKKSRAKKKGGRGSGGKKLEEVAKPPAFTVLE